MNFIDDKSLVYHGASVFTTMRTQNGEPLYFSEHLNRLKQHCAYFDFTYPGHTAIEQKIREAIDVEQIQRIRVTIGEKQWHLNAQPFQHPNPEIYQGVTTIISDIPIHPTLGRFKTGNYLPYLLAQKQAQKQGAFEALMLDTDGNVVDGTRTSPILFYDNTFIAPSGGLDGITRQQVLKKAHALGFRVESRYIKQGNCRGQILLAGTGVGLVPVGIITEPIIQQLVTKMAIVRHSALLDV